MKTRLLLAIVGSIALAGFAPAQSTGGKSGEKKAAAPKSAADGAYDEFSKLILDKTAKRELAHFKKIIVAGLGYLKEHPTHGKAADVVGLLAEYPSLALREKPLQPMRSVYLTTLKYDMLDARIQAETDDQKTALAALDAATIDSEVRDGASRGGLESLREKIDALTPMPGASRFLVDRERSYSQVVAGLVGPTKGEDHLKRLLDHKEKTVADMARGELDVIEVKRTPYALKFTAVDGRDVDFEKLRGKVVGVYFFSSTNRNSTSNIDAVRIVQSNYKKRGFELVSVSFDKADDREKLLAYVKANVGWPVYFDGEGSKNESWAKLGVKSVPRLVIFDQKGIMQTNDLAVNQLESTVKRMLNIK